MKYVKWSVFGISLLFFLLAIVFSYSESFSLCSQSLQIRNCERLFDNYSVILLSVFSFVLFFSIITLRMKVEVFSKWFNFTIWYVPLLVLTMIYFPLSVRGGLGAGSGITESFNALVLIFVFSIFVITSIVRIVRAYNKNK